MYLKGGKRLFDVICALLALAFFGWLYLLLAILVGIKLGLPVIFKQTRPGKDEKTFTMYKFRTMTEARDLSGNLLPDEKRLTNFGKLLRSTSLDELPEVWNILKGDMSLVGPRPQLVRDMVFMTPEQRKRHTVRPGLTGLAQVNGRNQSSWEQKLELDLQYIHKISFLYDLKIILLTVQKVFLREGISAKGMETAEDLGDYLLRSGNIEIQEYRDKELEANLYLTTTQREKCEKG